MENTHTYIQKAGYIVAADDGVEIFLTPSKDAVPEEVEIKSPNLEGSYQNTAIAYLTSEAPDCPLNSKTICGLTDDLPPELEVFFTSGVNKDDNTTDKQFAMQKKYSFTLSMGIMEGNEYSTAVLIISGRTGSLKFGVIRETVGEINMRKIYMTSFNDIMQPIIQEQSLVEGDPVWNCYVSALNAVQDISEWKDPDVCEKCPLNVISESEFKSI